ncbi:MAG: hypothetical protein ACK4NW_02115 [Roseinatronobacter sp.]
MIAALGNIRDMIKPDWRTRLADAVAASDLSKRAISLAAGGGPGYVHSVLTEGKDPTVERLMALCKVLGVSPAFILYGLDIEEEDAEVIAAMRDDPETRNAVLALLRVRNAS